MRTLCLGVTILLMLPCLLVFLFLTPPQYAQCKGFELDECFDVPGTVHKLTIDLSYFITFSVDSPNPALPSLSRLIPFSNSSTGCFVRASLREVTLTPVLLI